MPVLVTGASGFIGRHLTDKLLEGGMPIRVITRYPDRLPSEWAGRVEVVAGSLTDTGVLKAATTGMSLVFHLAGELFDASLMKAVNVDATYKLVRAAGAAGVKRFVHLSSVGVIGADDHGTITEEKVCLPKNEYERTKLKGEHAVLEFAREISFNAVVVRPSTVFGEGVSRSRDSLLEWMRALQKGRFAFIGQNARANYVYVGDVVEALLQLSERTRPGGVIFHVVDPAPMRDFVGAMAEALGVVHPTFTLPVWVAYVTAVGLEGANRILGTPAPLTLSRVRALSSSCSFSGEKLRACGKVTLPFGYRTGLMRTVRWYRETGKL